ncbi:unnamed protein product [Protopolystoma xenopodis]|uniref:Uncharacterized protein n=1 Tax=Protopolystoma xenopodis TaxID=117903 RepID=A0A3S5AVA6_9PLAT|nr:unnamed protein product [Protopolystoma xenopodis]
MTGHLVAMVVHFVAQSRENMIFAIWPSDLRVHLPSGPHASAHEWESGSHKSGGSTKCGEGAGVKSVSSQWAPKAPTEASHCLPKDKTQAMVPGPNGQARVMPTLHFAHLQAVSAQAEEHADWSPAMPRKAGHPPAAGSNNAVKTGNDDPRGGDCDARKGITLWTVKSARSLHLFIITRS